MEPLPKRLLPFFWHFIKPHKGFMGGLFLTGLLWGIHNSLSPYLLKLIIDAIASQTALTSAIWLPAVGYIAGWCIMALNFRGRDWIILRLFPAIRRDIINAMFAYLNRHSHSFLQNNFAGSLSNKIMDMAGSTASLFSKADEASACIFAFLISLLSMALIHPVFSIIAFIWVLFFISITVFFNKKTTALSHIFAESKSTLSGNIVDSVTNLANIRLFARNSYENTRLAEAVDETVNNDRAVQWYILKMRIGWDISFVILLGSMLTTLIVMWGQGKITVGDFAFIMTVSVAMFMNMWSISSQFVQIAEEWGKCQQALTIITAPHDIVDCPDAKRLHVTQGSIVFDNVSFHYQENNRLFENKHIAIEAGSKVGLVGFSGGGKTSFVNLILRLFDVEQGQILIDGQDIAKVTQDSLHEQISIIPQDTSLFHRSLMENIRYGRLTATDEEVIEASKQAHCHEFIDLLPEGYAALVGERGIKLSGGQRQRIAIARAILKDAPILILDEATSALDSVTEQYIQEGLNSLMQGRTTLVIAHRLSTLAAMGRILVFDKGHIIEDGTHEALLALGGHYAHMWHCQAGGFLPDNGHL